MAVVSSGRIAQDEGIVSDLDLSISSPRAELALHALDELPPTDCDTACGSLFLMGSRQLGVIPPTAVDSRDGCTTKGVEIVFTAHSRRMA
jgi:hypothetical protein